MRRRLKKLIGITTAAAMAVSLVPTTVFAEEPVAAIAEETAKNDNLLRVWYDEPTGNRLADTVTGNRKWLYGKSCIRRH